jgi:hypothetical protein
MNLTFSSQILQQNPGTCQKTLHTRLALLHDDNHVVVTKLPVGRDEIPTRGRRATRDDRRVLAHLVLAGFVRRIIGLEVLPDGRFLGGSPAQGDHISREGG